MPSPCLLEDDSANSVQYRIMTPEDVSIVTDVMAAAFLAGEPVTVIGGGATLRDMTAFCKMFVPRMAAEGNTILAVDADTNEVLGAFLNEDFCNEDPPTFREFLAQADGIWSPCLAMIDELEQALSTRHAIPAKASERASGRWFHLWMLGVAPAGRGRGVAKKLAAHSVSWARARGFEMAFAECTGAVSTHIMSTVGASPLASCDYATWRGEHDETLRLLPERGHPKMSMMVVPLNAPDAIAGAPAQ